MSSRNVAIIGQRQTTSSLPFWPETGRRSRHGTPFHSPSSGLRRRHPCGGVLIFGPVGANAVDDDEGALDMYTADVSGTEASELAAAGFDIADIRDTESG